MQSKANPFSRSLFMVERGYVFRSLSLDMHRSQEHDELGTVATKIRIVCMLGYHKWVLFLYKLVNVSVISSGIRFLAFLRLFNSVPTVLVLHRHD